MRRPRRLYAFRQMRAAVRLGRGITRGSRLAYALRHMKSSLLLLSAIIATTACDDANPGAHREGESVAAGKADSFGADCGPDTTCASLTSEVGAHVEVTAKKGARESEGSVFRTPVTIEVIYKDEADYFEESATLPSYLGLFRRRIHQGGYETYSRDHETIELQEVAPNVYAGKLQATLEGGYADNVELLDGVALAFSDGDGRWDSNWSMNYVVWLGVHQ